MLSRNSSWTFDREASLGLLFAAITYHDGQGFMVLRRPQVTSALELDKASICVQKGTTSELNLADYFRANSMTYELHAFETSMEAVKALESGACDVFTTDQSALSAERTNLLKPDAAAILPDIISRLISDSGVMAPGCPVLPIFRNTQLYWGRSGWRESFALPGVGSSRE